MKKEFSSHLEAIDWIAKQAQTESHFEILREELFFNHIYTGEYFLEDTSCDQAVAWL